MSQLRREISWASFENLKWHYNPGSKLILNTRFDCQDSTRRRETLQFSNVRFYPTWAECRSMIVFAPLMRVESFYMFQEKGTDASMVSFSLLQQFEETPNHVMCHKSFWARQTPIKSVKAKASV
ncbi:hypothetical protein BCON_0085g00120 [Botryotinia convoluta]|uniref:Uncharacterized protein n=1 Tax=Botryotinia convoluta TaxID=54673 RepID=A0A4Z1I8T3_9HELO|nr:hypothetical protein BCON_0085g00120 [Botryotinia convoluta]